MEDPAQIRARKRHSNRTVLAGVVLIAVSMFLSTLGFAPMLSTTVGALVGFVLVMYGVHVAWLVFYEKESDGPPS